MYDYTRPLTGAYLEALTQDSALSYGYVHSTVFGRSLGGRPLVMLTVGEGRPLVLSIATHHAMEWMCGGALLDFISAYRDATARGTSPRGTFCVVPLLNPDGVELLCGGWQEGDILAPRQKRANDGSLDFSHWQANGRGVDLNHNYPVGFRAYRDVEASLGIWEGAPTRYSGVSPLSEPETQAVAALIDLLSPDVTIALHTQGEEIFSGGAEGRAWMIAHLAARRLGYRHSIPEGAAAYGGLTDWLTARGMCAMTVECGKGENPLPQEAGAGISQKIGALLFSMPRIHEYVNFL